MDMDNDKQFIYMSGGFMSGGFEYNLTTESEFEEMKQINAQLIRDNENLKSSLEQLIKVNMELTDSMEEFNNSTQKHRYKSTNLDSRVQELNAEIEHYKDLALTQEDRSEIVNALEGLIDSFRQTQKYYEEEINSLCNEIDHYKNEWEEKLGQLEDMYVKKMRNVEAMVSEIRKKEEIVNIIERKMVEDSKSKTNIKKISKKYSTDLDTISEKMENRRPSLIHSDALQKQLEEVREKEKKLAQQLEQKDRLLLNYAEVLSNIRKKLMQKF